MRPAHLMIATALGLGPWVGSLAQNGLSHTIHAQVSSLRSSPMWQGRLVLGEQSPGELSRNRGRIAGWGLFGDYYFYRANLTEPTVLGISGFRATGGVMHGRAAAPLLFGSGAGVISRGLQGRYGSVVADSVLGYSGDDSANAYLGIGYTGVWVGSGWGFSTDVGLLALPDRSSVQFDRGSMGLGLGQRFEDIVREMRFAPLLQIGVSYSF